MAARGFIGAGYVYINRIDGGVKQGMKGPYYANKLEIKPNVDKKEQTSKGRDDYGQVLETVNINKPADFTLELSEVNRESMVIAFLGTGSALSQGSGTLTEEALVADHDSWVPLTKENITATPTVTHSTGSPTYVKGTDYEVNAQLGWIKVLSTGAIADGATIEVTATYSAITGSSIAGATNTDIRAEILFDGKNQADGLPCIVRVHEAVLAADSAFNFLADDFNTISLPGTLKTPTGESEPFVVELRDAA